MFFFFLVNYYINTILVMEGITFFYQLYAKSQGRFMSLVLWSTVYDILNKSIN